MKRKKKIKDLYNIMEGSSLSLVLRIQKAVYSEFIFVNNIWILWKSTFYFLQIRFAFYSTKDFHGMECLYSMFVTNFGLCLVEYFPP